MANEIPKVALMREERPDAGVKCCARGVMVVFIGICDRDVCYGAAIGS